MLLSLVTIASAEAVAQEQQELGRLFLTPERRQALDRQRQFNIQEQKEIPADPTLTINGLVTRDSGKRTIWINGMAQHERDTQTGIAVVPNRQNPGKVTVRTEDAPATAARVGDTINRTTGETSDLLRGGRISIRPGQAR